MNAAAQPESSDMIDTVLWLPHPGNSPIRANEIHIWAANLDLDRQTTSELIHLLNADEQSRSNRFTRESDRDRFIAAHSVLRLILGQYLGMSAKMVGLKRIPTGKPMIHDGSPLRFNLAHSDGLALFAFSLGREVGIDLERQRNDFINEEIVMNYFSENERNEYKALDPTLRELAFYIGWTRKEAYIKARGEGLRIPLHSFDVSLDPACPALLTSADAPRWEVHSFFPHPGFVASLVAEGKGCKLCHWQWKREKDPF